MKKIFGILGLLLVVCLFTAINSSAFYSPYNLENLLTRTALFGVISIGVAFVIVTGGIDLSIGSVIGLVGSLLPMLLVEYDISVGLAILLMVLLSLGIGLVHGLLITKLDLQPFVVTLCGLLVYRGLARWVTGGGTQGYGGDFDWLRTLAIGRIPLLQDFGLPVPFLLVIILGVVAAVFVNKTVYGRYLLALGRNEQATRYSGINTDRMILLAYVLCSLLAGLGGILFSLEINSVQPSSYGSFYELYAIAAAVLGGCSLRGGEASIAGVLIGTAVMQVLNNAIVLLGIDDRLELAIIGSVLLAGVMADELVKRYAARRRAAQEARAAA